MIACRRRGGNDDLVKELAGSMGDAVRVGEERLDRAGRVGRFIAQPARQPLELGGALRQLGDAAIVDQPQPALDRAQEIVGVAQLGVDERAHDRVPAQGRQGVPEIGPQQVRVAGGVQRAGGTGR